MNEKITRPHRKHSFTRQKERLNFFAMGGLGEIGKNMYVIEYKNEIIVIDCGLKFPDNELPGIDYVVPDVTYLENNKSKIRALIITHGHEDHMGAMPYVVPRLNVPIYATKLTLGLIKNKLQDEIPECRPDYNEIKAGEIIELGSFKIRFIAVAHSIPDSVALSIDTPIGRIVHTGDFKLDSTPIDGRITDFGAFAEEGDKGVLLLTSDSTNAERPGFTPSEKIISGTLANLFRAYKSKRIIISSFATNIHRIQQVADTAAKFNRKLALLGRSMLRNVELSRDLGYLKIDSKILIPVEDIWRYSGNQLVIMTTGSQGEPFSGLVTMSRGENKAISLSEHDVVFMLASIIPGNEKLVHGTINRLFATGCDVVYEKDKNVHVSGHASSEELKIILNLVRPQYFVPVHGEYRHMVRHSQLAQSTGIAPRNIFLMHNGDVLTFAKGSPPKIRDRVQSGAILVDGNATSEIKSQVMKERREISEDGVLVVAAAVDDRGELLSPVAIETQGVFFSDDTHGIYNELYAAAENAVKELSGGRVSIDALKRTIKTRIRDVLRRHNSSFAVVLPVISVKRPGYYYDDLSYEKEFF